MGDIGGDPCVEDETDETAYTFRMSVPSGSLLNHIEPTFKHLCFENGWDLIDDEVSFSKPRKGKTKFTMTIAVPKVVSLRHREVSGTRVGQRSQRGGGFDQAPGVYYGARRPWVQEASR